MAFAPDGGVLAMAGPSWLAAYDVSRRTVIAQEGFTNGQELLAFGHGTHEHAYTRSSVTGNCDRSGTISQSIRAARRITVRSVKDARTGSGKSIKACLDPERDLVWVATADSDKETMAITAHALADPTAPAHALTLPLGRVQQIGAMACRGRDVLLYVTAREGPGIDELDGATLLVKFNPDNDGAPPSYTRAFKAGTESYNNDWRGWVPRVKRFLDTPRDMGEFVRVDLGVRSGTFPLAAPLNIAPHGLSAAESIAYCRDRGADLIVAVTAEAGVGISIENPGRALAYRMTVPTTGFLGSCAITPDGRRIAIAAGGEDAVVIDLGVFGSGATGITSDASDYDPENEEPAIY